MMRSDPFSCADVVAHHRRHPGTYRHRAPVVMPKVLVGHLPDPRAVPFDARRTRFAIRTAVQFAACALFVAAAWLILLNA